MSPPATTTRRDTSRDGLQDKLQFRLLTGFGPVCKAAQRTPPVERAVNRVLINNGIMEAAPRPYRLSTLSDYTSLESLTDKTYNSRQLPPAATNCASLPDAREVAELFRRPVRPTAAGEAEVMTPCAKSTVPFAYFAQWFTDGFLRTTPRDSAPARSASSTPPPSCTTSGRSRASCSRAS